MEPSTTVRRSARARKAKVAEADWEDIDLSDLDEQIKPQKAKSQKAKPKAKPKAKGKAKRKADDMEEEEEDEEKQPAAIVIKGEPLVQEEVAFQDHSHALEQSFEFGTCFPPSLVNLDTCCPPLFMRVSAMMCVCQCKWARSRPRRAAAMGLTSRT